MGFYHLKNNLVGHRSDKTTLSVSTACPPRPALSSTERQRSAFVFDPGRGPRSSFNEPFAGSEARINVQQRLTELQRPPRNLVEHVDALTSKSASGAIGGIHICAEKQQSELERRILALYKAGFSFENIRKVLAERPTPYGVDKSVRDALSARKGGDEQMQTACISSFSSSHSLEDNSYHVLSSQEMILSNARRSAIRERKDATKRVGKIQRTRRLLVVLASTSPSRHRFPSALELLLAHRILWRSQSYAHRWNHGSSAQQCLTLHPESVVAAAAIVRFECTGARAHGNTSTFRCCFWSIQRRGTSSASVLQYEDDL
ncbi:hypothetical protein B0H13DRAFT_1902723 [Mycena leptocephala]|nr:hypothetical protein B0H13DRAFT_1902723 [Mycena leptocephala]